MKVKLPHYETKYQIRRKDAAEVTDWAYEMYQFDALHKMGLKGQGEVIAILDTGWNNRHPDIMDASVMSKGNYREGEIILHVEGFVGAGDIIDRNFHSTWIHGALGAAHNGFGVKGRCPKAKFVIMKVLQDDGSGDLHGLEAALYRCIELGYVTQIFMSLGLQTYVPSLHKAIVACRNAGIWLHGAAGNDYARNSMDYPAKYEEVISWGSHDKLLRRSAFSDTGVMLDLYGPGEDVLSCYGYGDYALNSGTSMSLPTGAACLVCYKKPWERVHGREMQYSDLPYVTDFISHLKAA